MENQITGYLSTSIDSFRSQLSNWSVFAKENYEKLKDFKDKVLEKTTKNQLEAQMQQDVLHHLDTMMSLVQKDLMRPILKFDSELEQAKTAASPGFSDKFQTGYQLISNRVKEVNSSVAELKRRSKHFIKRQEFGMRHGFYANFRDVEMTH